MFSLLCWLFTLKGASQVASKVYLPELITRSAAAMASSHRGVPVYTSAFRYNLANKALAALLVKWPYQLASPFSPNKSLFCRISFSIHAKTSARGQFVGFDSDRLSVTGTLP